MLPLRAASTYERRYRYMQNLPMSGAAAAKSAPQQVQLVLSILLLRLSGAAATLCLLCLLYTSDAADE